MADGLPLREYFRQVLGSQDVSKGGGGKEAGRVAGGEIISILIHFLIGQYILFFYFCENFDSYKEKTNFFSFANYMCIYFFPA